MLKARWAMVYRDADRVGGIVKPRSISLSRARELAHLVKAAPKKTGKGARKKNGRASTGVAVSESFFERYLGHFGVGSPATGASTARTCSRTANRPSDRKKAARKKR